MGAWPGTDPLWIPRDKRISKAWKLLRPWPCPLLLLLIPLLIPCKQVQACLLKDERPLAQWPLSKASQLPTSFQKKSQLTDSWPQMLEQDHPAESSLSCHPMKLWAKKIVCTWSLSFGVMCYLAKGNWYTGSPAVNNPLANVGDAGSTPG